MATDMSPAVFLATAFLVAYSITDGAWERAAFGVGAFVFWIFLIEPAIVKRKKRKGR